MAVSVRRHLLIRHRQPSRCPAYAALAPESIGRLLHKARLRARLSTDELAQRAGVDGAEVAAIDVGEPAEVASTVAFLLDLDHLGDILGLPGGIIEETLVQWARAFAECQRDAREGTSRIDQLGSAGNQIVSPAFHEAPPREDDLPAPLAAGHPPGRRVETWLRRVVVLATLLLVASTVALGLLQASGLWAQARPHHSATSGASPAMAASEPLLSLLGVGSSSTSYLSSSSGQLSVSFVSSRPCWVEVASGNGPALLAATVGPGITAPIGVEVPFVVQVGAGGTSVLVSSRARSETLTPPSAPFTIHVLPG